MKIRIVADSSVDMFTMPGHDFAAVPLTISTHERTFVDSPNLDVGEMLTYLAGHQGRSYTACPGLDAWLDCYEGADVIYVVVLTSALSGTYNAAVAAANLYRESHPQAQVRVFDTLSAGPEVRLLAEYIGKLVAEGREFAEVCSLAEDYLRHTRIFFALESFHNLVQNGRVHRLVAAAAGVLGVRILATGSTRGEIQPVGKCRGEKKLLDAFLTHMDEAGYAGGRVYLAHCQNPDLAAKLAQAVKTRYPGAEVGIYETRGLCSYYAERGGLILSCECEKSYT